MRGNICVIDVRNGAFIRISSLLPCPISVFLNSIGFHHPTSSDSQPSSNYIPFAIVFAQLSNQPTHDLLHIFIPSIHPSVRPIESFHFSSMLPIVASIFMCAKSSIRIHRCMCTYVIISLSQQSHHTHTHLSSIHCCHHHFHHQDGQTMTTLLISFWE